MQISELRLSNFKSYKNSGPIALGSINVFTGKNNSGKSALIQALALLQQGRSLDHNDIRKRAPQYTIECQVAHVDTLRFMGLDLGGTDHGGLLLSLGGGESTNKNLIFKAGRDQRGVIRFSQHEPNNFIYSYLAKRKVTQFVQQVDQERARLVTDNLQNLVSKVVRLANPDNEQHEQYSALCEKVLGFRVTAHPSPNGMQAGIPIGNQDYLPIEAMGEGVPNLLGLIVHLCIADGNLFLIEELENDVHPEALKALLEVIVEKSASNQFIISTHSNIVVRHLGAAPKSLLYEVELDYQRGQVPTSSVHAVPAEPAARIEVLRKLGYELYDFDLWDGWLILEESSAEVIIRDYLIPWFAPRLSRVRTLAAGGTDKVEPTFEDFRRLFLFTHLQPGYNERAWVVIDGDDGGKRVVKALRAKYNGWPAEHFKTLVQTDFERYYPKRFKAEVDALLALHHDKKPTPKRDLLNKVKEWCKAEPEEAKREFEQSAAEVIAILKAIEAKVAGTLNDVSSPQHSAQRQK